MNQETIQEKFNTHDSIVIKPLTTTQDMIIKRLEQFQNEFESPSEYDRNNLTVCNTNR